MRRNPNRGRISSSASIPAPTGGWNGRDSIARMPTTDAVILDNYVPSSTDVRLRKGYINWSTGYPAAVESLFAYNGEATSKLFAVSGTSIYDATASGAVGAPVVTGLSNARWRFANFSNTGGKWLFACNGVDKLRLYDGTTWEAVDGASAHPITGITTSEIVNVTVHQNRVWFIRKETLQVYYLATAAISGAATLLDLRSLFRRGGYLVAMGSWTIDSGAGMDDHAVFISSEGEVAVYQGTDPSSASTWALKGTYVIGTPIGYNCLTQYASDLLIISQDGLFPLSKALASSRVTTATSLTDKIQTPMADAVSNYASNFGWSATGYSTANLLILNIPVTGASQQYVMNTITGAWCRFLGWNAYCFEMSGDSLFFGSTNFVAKAWTGQKDNTSNIIGEALQAFSYLGNQSLKQVKMARPIFTVEGSIGLKMIVNMDFNTTPPSSYPTTSNSFVGIWDTSKWDTGLWGGAATLVSDWQTVFGIGRAAALHIVTASNSASISWAATDYLYENARGLV